MPERTTSQQTRKFLDATDALSVALCHHYQKGNNAGASSGKSWGKFLADNPERLGASTGGRKKAGVAKA